MKGVLASVHASGEFGHIKPDDGGADVHFWTNEFIGARPTQDHVGRPVEWDKTEESPKGLHALRPRFAGEPTSTRPDFSKYVVHFTKDAPPLGAERNPDDENIKSITGTAYDRLVSILTDGRIRATPMPWTNKPAVAFTECPFWSLLDHASRYSPFGVGFTKAHLFASGGGPAIYLRPDLHEKQDEFLHKDKAQRHGFHPHVYAFVTPFAPAYAPQAMKDAWGKGVVDYTHEREWRVPHDFDFRLDEVQFVIVESYEDLAKFPKKLKDEIGRDNFVIMHIYHQIERFWPTHRVK